MIKKINSSLYAKVFLLTAGVLLAVSLLVFGLLAWLMPATYSGQLSAALKERTEAFVSELEQAGLSNSGGLFDAFLRDAAVYSVELYNAEGEPVPLPSLQYPPDGWGNTAYAAQTAVDAAVETPPIFSGSYDVSFSGGEGQYLLLVYGAAEQVGELQRAFLRVFPVILLVVLAASLAVSGLYSRMITRPVLLLSDVSEKMAGLQLDQRIGTGRTDELGRLEKSLDLLARRLSAALSELQSANRQLKADIEHEKELEQARTSFFAAASHELKTPITIIKGQLEGMLLGIGAYQDHQKYLARSLQVANTLEGMVQEILTVSRLEAAGAELKKERIDLVPAIRAYLDETEDLIAEKGLQVSLDLPPAVFALANRPLMEKVFSNLIGNAIRYSPRGALITIACFEKCGQAGFSVENTGVHLPEEAFSKLFSPFYRVEESRSRKTGGSGLGLYLVQEILRQHGSECTACNTPDGVRFSFLL